jgi:hypothetical protein
MLQSTFWFLWMPQLNMTVNAGPVRSLTSLSSQSGMFHLFISRRLAFEVCLFAGAQGLSHRDESATERAYRNERLDNLSFRRV